MDFVQDWVRQSATVLSVSKNCIGAGKHLRLVQVKHAFCYKNKGKWKSIALCPGKPVPLT